MLGIIWKGTENKPADGVTPLYKSMVRQHLEYHIYTSSQKDRTELGEVQKKETKIINGMEYLPRRVMLKLLGLFSI